MNLPVFTFRVVSRNRPSELVDVTANKADIAAFVAVTHYSAKYRPDHGTTVTLVGIQ